MRKSDVLPFVNGAINSYKLCDICTTDKIFAVASLSENEVIDIKSGDDAIVEIPILKKTNFGRIYSVNRVANETGLFDVRIDIEGADSLYPGMSFIAEIIVQEKYDVPSISMKAISNINGIDIIYTDYDAENNILINPITVRFGCSDWEYIELYDEDKLGDYVYYYDE